jgi:hypothetical protein
MTTFADPVFSTTYQGLCNKIADTLNRQDLTSVIPDFTMLATKRIERDLSRLRHPSSITRSTASAVDNYIPLPSDFVSIYQLLEQDTSITIDYISPDQSKAVMAAQSYTPRNNSKAYYYTIIGNQLRVYPPIGVNTPLLLDLWYFSQLTPLNNTYNSNWVLTRYPDLYLYGSLVHSAPYLKADDRIQVWESAYQTILKDIEVEAERSMRSQTKLNATRRTF